MTTLKIVAATAAILAFAAAPAWAANFEVHMLNKDSVRKVHSKHRSKGSDSSPTIRMHKEVDLSKVSHKALRSKDSDNSLTDSPLGNHLPIHMHKRC